MTEESNCASVRRLTEAVAPDSEWDISRSIGLEAGVYGVDQVRPVLEEIFGLWESVRLEAEFIDAGDLVVVPLAGHVRGRDGIEAQARITWAWTLREGAVVRACLYQDRDEALEAARLSE